MDITLTLQCNNNCIFCPRQDYLKLIACGSLKEIHSDIEKTRFKSEKIVLSGGEVTLRQDLWSILTFCNSRGFKEIGLITNGRRLKELDFAERLIRAGVKDFAVSLYSANEKIHDGITRRKGSARDTKKGILNLLALSRVYPINIRVNLVLNYWNYEDLPDTLNKLVAWGVRNFIVAEQVIIDAKSKHLSLDEIKVFVKNIQELTLEDTRLCLRGFAFCLFGQSGGMSAQGIILKEKNPCIILESQEVDTLVKEGGKKKAYMEAFGKLFFRMNKCNFCVLESRCPGIQKAYF